MLWLFKRGEESLRLRTTYDNDTRQFVATVLWSHGTLDEKRFTTLAAFRAWLKAFETALEEEKWKCVSHPLSFRTADQTNRSGSYAVSYTHLRAHETGRNLVC